MVGKIKDGGDEIKEGKQLFSRGKMKRQNLLFRERVKILKMLYN